jgi:hypothetical protein
MEQKYLSSCKFDVCAIREYTKQKTALSRRCCSPWRPEGTFNKQSVHVDVRGEKTKKCQMGWTRSTHMGKKRITDCLVTS